MINNIQSVIIGIGVAMAASMASSVSFLFITMHWDENADMYFTDVWAIAAIIWLPISVHYFWRNR